MRVADDRGSKKNGADQDEPWRGLLTPCPILPSQFFAEARIDTPARKLLVALLEEAAITVRCGREHGTRQDEFGLRALRLWWDVVSWVGSADDAGPDRAGCFTFLWVCGQLDLDVGQWRARFLAVLPPPIRLQSQRVGVRPCPH
jgi:hypothetical protein